jgi:tetratricopeptide (TPR) repeat protein
VARKKHRPQTGNPGTSQIHSGMRGKNIPWISLLPVATVLIAYLPALGNGFVWDDIFEFFPPEVVNEPGSWLKAITGSFEFSVYFRPLTLLTYLIEMKLFGKSAAEMHFMNIFVMAINTWMVTLLATRLVNSQNSITMGGQRLKWLPLVIGGSFGLHPALIEGVVWISSRFDLMMTGFILAALLADLVLQRSSSRPIVVGLLFLLAALCKESAIAFIFILPFWHLAIHSQGNPNARPLKMRLGSWWSREKSSGDLSVYLALLCAGLAYLGLRHQVLGYLYDPIKRAPEYIDLNAFNHLLLFGKTVASYSVLILFPFFSIAPYHAVRLILLSQDISAWIGICLAIIFLIMILLQLKKPARSTWLLLAGVAALLPVMNLLPLGLENFAGERFLLLPVSLLAFMALDIPQSFWQQTRGRIASILWGLSCLATILVTIPHWKNDLTFWTWANERDRLSALPSNNLSSALIINGDYQLAAETAAYAASINTSDLYEKPWVNLGHAYFKLGRYADAVPVYQKAIELKTSNGYVYTQLPQALISLERYEEAAAFIQAELFKRAPELPLGHLMLAHAHAEIGNPEQAAISLSEFLTHNTQSLDENDKNVLFQVWMLIGAKLFQKGDVDGAMAAYRNAENSGTSPLTIGLQLSGTYYEMENYQEMERVLLAAVQEVPQSAELYNDLGVAVLKQGDYIHARLYFEKAIELNPNWSVPRNNLNAVPAS